MMISRLTKLSKRFSDNATEQATHISTNQTENIHNFMFILPIT